MELLIIRHSITQGNLEGRYIGGVTDQPLCSDGIALASQSAGHSLLDNVEKLYRSPMLRCRQTAEILFPSLKSVPVEGLREMNFGIFEGKTFTELQPLDSFQSWLSSECTGKIESGESMGSFSTRCAAAFEAIMRSMLIHGYKKTALVVHGGVIMALMSVYALPKRSYHEWLSKNCSGYLVHTDEQMFKEKKMELVDTLNFTSSTP